MSDAQSATARARHLADYRDELEYAEVAAVLATLPDGHPARTASASCTIELTRLVDGRRDIADALMAAYWAGYRRYLRDHFGGHFRP